MIPASSSLTATGPPSAARASCPCALVVHTRRGGVAMPSAPRTVLAWSSSNGPDLTARSTQTAGRGYGAGARVLDQGRHRGGEGARAGEDGHTKGAQRPALGGDLRGGPAQRGDHGGVDPGQGRGQIEGVRFGLHVHADQVDARVGGDGREHLAEGGARPPVSTGLAW